MGRFLQWSDFSAVYHQLMSLKEAQSIQLREEKKFEESNEFLKSAKLYFKIIHLMEGLDSDFYFHALRGFYTNYAFLEDWENSYAYTIKAIEELERVGWTHTYWKSQVLYDRALIFILNDQRSKGIVLMEQLIIYLESEELDPKTEDLLNRIHERLVFILEPVEWKTL